jgi:hypothetical protein
MTRGVRRRDDSYEKIEMNHKEPSMLNHAGGGTGRGTLPKGGNVLPSGQNAEVAVVGPMVMKQRLRRGEYRGVPSVDTDVGEDDADDDDEGGYEDEVETPTPTTVVSSTRNGKMSWSGPRSSDDTPSSQSELRGTALSDPTDLHIPRGGLCGYLDNRYVKETTPFETDFIQFFITFVRFPVVPVILFAITYRPTLEPTHFPILWVQRAFFPGLKCPGRETIPLLSRTS